MKLVITGSAGHLAQVLLPQLVENPAIQHIIGLDHQATRFQHTNYHHIQADIRDNEARACLEGADVLLHMAFVLMGGGLGKARFERETLREINIHAGQQWFEHAAKMGVKRLIFVSSCAAYGAWPDNPKRMDESQVLRAMPGFAYAEDKVAFEQWLDGFAAQHPECSVLRLRPHVILGKKAHPFLRNLLKQPFYPAIDQGEALSQCVWESDVVDAIESSLINGQSGAYNLAAEPPLSFKTMLKIRNPLIIPLPVKMAILLHGLLWKLTPRVGEPGWVQGMQYDLAVTTDKARKELHWQPKYNTQECIKKL